MTGTIVVKLDNIPDGENTFIKEYEANLKVSKGKSIKKFLIIGAVITLFSLIFACGMIVGFKNSEPYEKSLKAIGTSDLVEDIVGEITGYGAIPAGSISTSNGSGRAYFRIKVKGTEGECVVVVYLVKDSRNDWKVIDAVILNN